MLRESLANGLIFEGSSTYVQQNAGPNSQLQLLCVGANTSQINDNFLPPKLHLQKKIYVINTSPLSPVFICLHSPWIMKKSDSLCAQLHNSSLEFYSVGFQQALGSVEQGPVCSGRQLLLPNQL